jgi:hypothetical protein
MKRIVKELAGCAFVALVFGLPFFVICLRG